jgi:hypothetical protein
MTNYASHAVSTTADKLRVSLSPTPTHSQQQIIKMETEFYSGVNWASPTDHAEAVFPWETESPRSGQADVWGSELDLLLSASSYPIPEPPHLHDQEDQQQENNLVALYGGVLVHEENTADEPDFFQPTPEARSLPAPNPLSNRISKPAESAATRKRGRPRKLMDDAGVNAEEVSEASNLDSQHLTQ